METRLFYFCPKCILLLSETNQLNRVEQLTGRVVEWYVIWIRKYLCTFKIIYQMITIDEDSLAFFL